jgi:hypothetical protein
MRMAVDQPGRNPCAVEAARPARLTCRAIFGATDPRNAAIVVDSNCGVTNGAEAVANLLPHGGGVTIEE